MRDRCAGRSFLVSSGNLFTFSRASDAPETPDFILALPVLAIVWVLVGIAISLRPGARGRRGGVEEGVVDRCCPDRGLWRCDDPSGPVLALPRPYTLLQFGYRLETYVLLGLSASMLVILDARAQLAADAGGWDWVGAAMVLARRGSAQSEQVDGYPKGTAARLSWCPIATSVFAPNNQPPNTAGGLGDYDDATLPLVEPAGQPGGGVPNDRPPPGRDDPRRSPGRHDRPHGYLAGAPYLVSVTGARVGGSRSSTVTWSCRSRPPGACSTANLAKAL